MSVIAPVVIVGGQRRQLPGLPQQRRQLRDPPPQGRRLSGSSLSCSLADWRSSAIRLPDGRRALRIEAGHLQPVSHAPPPFPAIWRKGANSCRANSGRQTPQTLAAVAVPVPLARPGSPRPQSEQRSVCNPRVSCSLQLCSPTCPSKLRRRASRPSAGKMKKWREKAKFPVDKTAGSSGKINPAVGTAGVAQLVEQLICNQQVGGSNPSTSSTISYGGIPERSNGADCKSVAFGFGGSNPPSPTKGACNCGRFFSFCETSIL